ncbi:hypothetical protein [Pseudazoarcus pumilus]|uniref:Uncharacterized protein n=1 Tax=Pseudazoarcus pumilus TaxID=2067960 RepID=A0A2I6S834_9RHOO|nr:hypothetical protein [Pseudazoarcus pumilus]AUN95430.1 hypothetical protein C0099_11120 [Pseudazoarcus pumilus]
MSTPPNRPQIQRPTLEDCAIVERHLRYNAIEAARRGNRRALDTLMWRYSVLVLLDVASKADCDALFYHCDSIAAQARKEPAA